MARITDGRRQIGSGTRDRWRGVLDTHLLPEFGTQTLRALTLAQVEAYKARRLTAGAAPATVRYPLSLLRHMYRRAVEWEYLNRNPLDRLEMPKEANGGARYLSDDEIGRPLAAIPRRPTAPS